jgi:D-sedoheptulose 7-phosphate isomerase
MELTTHNAAEWLADYLARYQKSIFETDVTKEIIAFKELCLQVKQNVAQLIIAGNGASASIASHACTDFTKQGGVRAMCFNEANLITAFANDYGYEKWVEKAVGFYAKPGDVIVLISSSGRSANLVNAAAFAKEKGMKVVTFTGFAPDNPLKTLGDINFWMDSRAYNIIECTHMIWITAVVDLILGKAEYSVS